MLVCGFCTTPYSISQHNRLPRTRALLALALGLRQELGEKNKTTLCQYNEKSRWHQWPLYWATNIASSPISLQMYLEHTTLILSVGAQDRLRDCVAIQETLCFPEKTGQHHAVIGRSCSELLTQGSPSLGWLPVSLQIRDDRVWWIYSGSFLGHLAAK